MDVGRAGGDRHATHFCPAAHAGSGIPGKLVNSEFLISNSPNNAQGIENPPRAAAYGLGCRSRRGPSIAAPVETLGMHFRQILICRELGIDEAICVIGQQLAMDSFSNPEDKSLAELAGDEQAGIARRVAETAKGVRIRVVMDREVLKSPEYTGAFELLRHFHYTPYAYMAGATALFEAVRQIYGATLKVGWTRVKPEQLALVSRSLREGRLPSISDEVAFDAFRREFFEARGVNSMSFLYGPAAISLKSENTACPYTCDRSSAGGRLLLRFDEIERLPSKLCTRKFSKPSRALGFARALESLAQIVLLADLALPGIVDTGDIQSYFDEVEHLTREAEKEELSHGRYSVEYGESRRILNRFRAESASSLCRILPAPMETLIRRFAVL